MRVTIRYLMAIRQVFYRLLDVTRGVQAANFTDKRGAPKRRGIFVDVLQKGYLPHRSGVTII